MGLEYRVLLGLPSGIITVLHGLVAPSFTEFLPGFASGCQERQLLSLRTAKNKETDKRPTNENH